MIPRLSYLLVAVLVMGMLIIFHHTPSAALLGALAFTLGYLVKRKKSKS